MFRPLLRVLLTGTVLIPPRAKMPLGLESSRCGRSGRHRCSVSWPHVQSGARPNHPHPRMVPVRRTWRSPSRKTPAPTDRKRRQRSAGAATFPSPIRLGAVGSAPSPAASALAMTMTAPPAGPGCFAKGRIGWSGGPTVRRPRRRPARTPWTRRTVSPARLAWPIATIPVRATASAWRRPIRGAAFPTCAPSPPPRPGSVDIRMKAVRREFQTSARRVPATGSAAATPACGFPAICRWIASASTGPGSWRCATLNVSRAPPAESRQPKRRGRRRCSSGRCGS